MRLAPLLAQYLYLHKKLDLPGLGTFILEESDLAEPDNSRHAKSIHTENIKFETNIAVKESPELIAFISAQTGKIKALASADLESHLELAHQFLNIGKPFFIEGIGTIDRIRPKEFTFTPGPAIAELKKEAPKEQVVLADDSKEDYNYKNIFYSKPVKAKWKKPVAVLLLVVGLVVAIWGGYTVYKKTSAKKDNQQAVVEPSVQSELKDTTAIVQDSSSHVVEKPVTPTNPAGTYKFILESADSARTAIRLKQLKTFQWNVEMEKVDAGKYRIYMVIPSSATDTTRIIDSLTRLTGRKVFAQ